MKKENGEIPESYEMLKKQLEKVFFYAILCILNDFIYIRNRGRAMIMRKDQLYDAAFRYKKAGIWKKLWDNEVFAIKLTCGETGYISIMGKNGTYCALGLYIGASGFQSYRALANAGGYTGSPFRDHEMLLQQDCLQIALGNKDDLMPEEVEEVREYAKKNGIRLSGRNTFPQFVKYEPNCHPWKVKTKEDQQALYEAMEAAVLMADVLRTADPKEIGILEIAPDTKEVPLFEVKGDQLIQAGTAPLSPEKEDIYECVPATNEVAMTYVKKLRRKGIWEVELIRMLEPVQDHPEETPYYPLVLLAVDSKSYYALPFPMGMYAEKNPQEMLNTFADGWRNQKIYPREIRCRDERTYALLKDFCEKTNVKISIFHGEMAALDDVEYEFFDHMSGEDTDKILDEMAMVVEELLQMSPSELKMMPEPLMEQLELVLSQGLLPDDIAAELKKKLDI